jgi:hypothetical protein
MPLREPVINSQDIALGQTFGYFYGAFRPRSRAHSKPVSVVCDLLSPLKTSQKK